MVASWVLFPLVLLALCAGCGLAVARAAGGKIAAPLILPLGLAALVVVASAATASGATAKAAAPLVVALALAGFALADDRLAWAPGRWPALAAAGVFVVFALPVAATGQATFTGYIQLDDIATWLALTDHVMVHGRDLSGLAPSTHEATLDSYLPGGYPVGAFLPLGLGHALTGVDVAWLFAPTLALIAALLALTLTQVVAGLVAAAPARAAIAFVAAQPALLFSYAEWGALKEVLAVLLVALLAALSPALGGPARRALAPAVGAAALVAALSAGALAWVVPVLAISLVVGRPGWRGVATTGPAFALAVAALSVPSLLLARTFLAPQVKTGSVLSAGTELGNLREPLGLDHVLGIWPAGDFRLTPDAHALTTLLLSAVAVAAAWGLGLALRHRDGPLAGYVAGGLAGCAALVWRGSPWVDAKAMATASPIALTAGLAALAAAGSVAALGRPARLASALAIGTLGAAVLWSNGLTYGASYPAPRAQLAELASAGRLLAGQGPTLMTGYEPYGARHFLRAADAESASELRRRVIPLRDGTQVPKSAAADITDFDPVALRSYRSLVLRVSPLASRPPSAYGLRRAGSTYELWQRAARPPAPFVADLPLGGPSAPGAVPACAAVRGLAAQAGAGGHLVTVAREVPVVAELGRGPLPAGWATVGADGRSVVPDGAGRLTLTVAVPAAGRWAVWLGGSTRGATTIRVDRRAAGTVRTQLNNQGAMLRFATLPLTAGRHRVTITYADGGLRPGSRGQAATPLPFGPLVLSTPRPIPAPVRVPVTRATSLCGRTLDWIEAFPAGA